MVPLAFLEGSTSSKVHNFAFLNMKMGKKGMWGRLDIRYCSKSDPGMQTILQEISRIRHGLTSVQHYDTLSVPLVYTQVIHKKYNYLYL